MVTAAIVGLGWWGQRMVEAVRGPSYRLSFRYGVGGDPANDAEIAAANGLVLLATLDEALAHPEVDAVVLATPHSLHVPQILACAAAGKPVFSEKPLALTLADAQRAVAACRDAGVVLGIGTDRRFLPAMRALKTCVAGGRLGRLLHVEAQYSNDVMSRGLSGGWRKDPAEAPGAGMTGPGLHALDGLIDLAGPVARLAGQIHAPEGSTKPIDAVSLLIRFRSGATGLLGCVRGVPDYVRMAVFGSAGWAEMRDWRTLHLNIAGKPEGTKTFDPTLAIGDLLDRFADAVENHARFPVSTESMLETVGAFEAAITALTHDRMVDLPASF